jgi:hypothetical protein
MHLCEMGDKSGSQQVNVWSVFCFVKRCGTRAMEVASESVVRVGLLGCSWIAPIAILNQLPFVKGVQVSAVAARDEERGTWQSGEDTFGITNHTHIHCKLKSSVLCSKVLDSSCL